MDNTGRYTISYKCCYRWIILQDILSSGNCCEWNNAKPFLVRSEIMLTLIMWTNGNNDNS